MLRPATKRTRRHHLSHPVNSRALARAILAVTACYLALGLVCLAAWRVTGKIAWIDVFFKYPAAILMVILATTELLVSQRVASEFDRRQPLRRAWRLIGLSAGFNLASAVLVQILATWNPAVSAARQLGLLLGGPCRFAAMSAGLLWTLKAYRRSGLLARLRPGDWAVLALMGCYVFLEFRDVVLAWGHGMRPTIWMVLGWPTDPLLWILLAQALRLYRSALEMGSGLVGRCWSSFSIGVFLVTVGDVTMWATNMGYLSWEWRVVEWYIWLPAAAAFALAPLYQLHAIALARTSAVKGSSLATSIS